MRPPLFITRNIETCNVQQYFKHNGKLCYCMAINGTIVKYWTMLSNGTKFITTYDRAKVEEKKEEPKPFISTSSFKVHVNDARVVKLAKGKVKVEFLNNSFEWVEVTKNFKSVTKANEYLQSHFVIDK